MDSNSLISNDTPPPTTISNHLHGRKTASIAHEGQQLLDNAQKAAVIDWCQFKADMASPMSHVRLHAVIQNLTNRVANNS